MKRAIAALAAILFVAIATTAAARAESRVALVIGNGAYQHTSALKNPANDAAQMSSALRKIGFSVVEGRDLTRAAFEEKLRAFSDQANGADVALVFYAGHGLQVSGENWLIPVDAQIASEMDLALSAIRLTSLLKTMDRGVRTRLVFLDACRDNPMAGTLSGSAARGLARVEAEAGALIAFSTQPGAVAGDGRGNNSPFTTALLDEIGTPDLEVRQMLSKVRERVLAASERAQEPWDHSSLTKDFYFAPTGAKAATAVAANAEAACKRGQEVVARDGILTNLRDLERQANECLAGDTTQAWGHYLRAFFLNASKRVPEAMVELDHAIARDPNYVDALLLRGTLLIAQNLDQAERDFKRVVEIEPKNIDALGWLSRLAEERGDSNGALALLNKALSYDARNGALYATRGYTFVRLGQDDLAFADFEQAIKLDPDSWGGRLGRATLYFRRGERTRGESDYAHLLMLSPTSADVYMSRGWAYTNAGAHALGRADFEKALEFRPAETEAVAGRAVTNARLGDRSAARADIAEFIKRNSNNGRQWLLLGEAQSICGDHGGALASYDRAIALGLAREHWATLRLGRSDAYLALGRRAEAIAEFRLAEKVSPQDPQVAKRKESLGLK